MAALDERGYAFAQFGHHQNQRRLASPGHFTNSPKNMSPLKNSLIGALLLATMALWGGCSMQSQHDSSIPWNKPADWEGQIPGMGTDNIH